MEDSHYFLKTIGLESYMDHDKTFCDSEMDNLDYGQLAYGGNESALKIKIEPNSSDKGPQPDKDDVCDKQDQVINDEVSQIMAKVQADDFFSSLELQSSTKTSTSSMSLTTFQSKPTGGILTRSRSLMSANVHDLPKPLPESRQYVNKTRTRQQLKRKRDRVPLKRLRKVDVANKQIKNKTSRTTKRKKQPQHHQTQQTLPGKVFENILNDKTKEEDDWIFFQQLATTKKPPPDDKLFDNKQLLGSDLTHATRRCTPELFSMSPILMSDVMEEDKDEVGDLLEDDYDETFLEEMDDFGNAPPRSHTGGKWKPGSQPVRTSPMLWPTQNWETVLEDEGGKLRSETPIESPTTSTPAKWKSFAPPATHTGGKWKPLTPPATHTGGKWKPSDSSQRSKKDDQEVEYADNIWKYEGQSTSAPPIRHTGGKWKPNSSLIQSQDQYKEDSTATKAKPNVPSAGHTHGKWVSCPVKTSSFTRSTLDIVATCQSTSGKCLKTSGGAIQYYCSPCNRRLSSKKMYKNHIQSELHLKRVLQENDLEFDSRSLKMYRGLFVHSARNDRGLGKRVIKKPEMYQDEQMNAMARDKNTSSSSVRIKRKKITRKEVVRCDVCRIKVPGHQLGKHLVSYYHTRRSQLADPQQRDLILNNIHAIVKQAPYQCAICKFYCNSHATFKRHWALPVHKTVEETTEGHRFWCAFCSFECEASNSMELHLDSNSHREVIQAVNKSIPIIIRHKRIFRCPTCFKEFRFNRELIRHQERYHSDNVTHSGNRYTCTLCKRQCKTMKSLQKHIIQFHKGQIDVPYFCSLCDQFFTSVDDAKEHRNGQLHKQRKTLAEKGDVLGKHSTRLCSYCGKTLLDLQKLKAHVFECHQSLLPKCIKCGKLFALSQQVSRHVKKNECHFPPKRTPALSPSSFNCDICSFSTNLQSEFLLHGAIHRKKDSDDRKIDCPLCPSQYTQSALSVHLRVHLKEKTYQCSMCPSTFVRKDRYVAHLKWKHLDKGDRSRTPKIPAAETKGDAQNEKNRQKDVEKDGDASKLVLERRQVCGDAKCKYVAKDSNDLRQHSLIHVGPKVYQCPECPYSGKTNTVIKRHYMIHLGEKHFSCPHCPFKGRLRSHLKRHMRLHTGAKPYKCPHCSYTCNILENLRKHVLNTKIHPGKKLYECKMCSYATNGSKEFKSHLMESHDKDCRVADAIVAAGIYNKEEDVAKSAKPLFPAKSKTSTKNPRTNHSSEALDKKIESVTRRFAPIAPKQEKLVTSRPGNSLEDKRKLLELELEKLKTQIKPPSKKTVPRSYPSPVDKVFRAKRPPPEPEKEPRKTTTSGRRPLMIDREDQEETEGGSGKALREDGDMMLIMEGENRSKPDPDFSIQSLKLSPSTYVLCNSEMEPEETELYLLENYEVS